MQLYARYQFYTIISFELTGKRTERDTFDRTKSPKYLADNCLNIHV